MPLRSVTQRMVAIKIVSTKILWHVQAQMPPLFSYSVELMEAVVARQLLVVLSDFEALQCKIPRKLKAACCGKKVGKTTWGRRGNFCVWKYLF